MESGCVESSSDSTTELLWHFIVTICPVIPACYPYSLLLKSSCWFCPHQFLFISLLLFDSPSSPLDPDHFEPGSTFEGSGELSDLICLPTSSTCGSLILMWNNSCQLPLGNTAGWKWTRRWSERSCSQSSSFLCVHIYHLWKILQVQHEQRLHEAGFKPLPGASSLLPPHLHLKMMAAVSTSTTMCPRLL